MSDNLDTLSAAGYRQLFERDVYFNRETRKIFSLEAVEDHDDEWLRERMIEPNVAGGWRFYFNDPVPEELRGEILREIS